MVAGKKSAAQSRDLSFAKHDILDGRVLEGGSRYYDVLGRRFHKGKTVEKTERFQIECPHALLIFLLISLVYAPFWISVAILVTAFSVFPLVSMMIIAIWGRRDSRTYLDYMENLRFDNKKQKLHTKTFGSIPYDNLLIRVMLDGSGPDCLTFVICTKNAKGDFREGDGSVSDNYYLRHSSEDLVYVRGSGNTKDFIKKYEHVCKYTGIQSIGSPNWDVLRDEVISRMAEEQRQLIRADGNRGFVSLGVSL